MLSMIFLALYYFFMVLETILLLYILSSWFPGTRVQRMLYEMLNPVFSFIHLLLRHSIFKSSLGDPSPMLALLLFSWLQNFFYQLSSY